MRIIESYPREVAHEVIKGHPYVALTRTGPPIEGDEVERIWDGRLVPAPLRELWTNVGRCLYLFYTKGSDGLIIYDPETSLTETNALETDYWIEDDSYHESDIIVGDFQGDDQRLIFSPEDGWIVYGAIDTRDSWLRLGDSLDRFLIAFRDAGGNDGDWSSSFFRD